MRDVVDELHRHGVCVRSIWTLPHGFARPGGRACASTKARYTRSRSHKASGWAATQSPNGSTRPSCVEIRVISESGFGWQQLRGLDTSGFPVELVSWEETQSFCLILSRRAEERRHQRRYRLPTEAEWEFSCRGGILCHPFTFGDHLSSHQANFNGSDPSAVRHRVRISNERAR